MKNWPSSLLLNLFLICLVASCAPSCSCDGDDEDDSGVPPISDDDADDDTSDDDDAVDDDAADDDDDSTDDDVDDDDTADDDDAIDDDDFIEEMYPPDDGTWYEDIFFQNLLGGYPGYHWQDMEIAEGGTVYIASPSGTYLYCYTVYTDGTMEREKVGLFGDDPDIEIDADGYLHIAYWNDWNNSVYYATNQSGAWVLEKVADVDSYWNVYPALEIRSDGRIVIAIGWQAITLYTQDGTGVWDAEDVVNGRIMYFSMDLDSADHVHLAYALPSWLYYATNKTGVWTNQLVDINFGDPANDIQVDSQGHAHIAYQGVSQTYSILRYATNATGNWVVTHPLWIPDIGAYPSIALDSGGFAHIGASSDFNLSRQAYEYFHYTTNKSGNFENYYVEPDYLGVYSPKIALDASDNVYGVYQRRDSQEDEAELQLISHETQFTSGESLPNISHWPTQIVERTDYVYNVSHARDTAGTEYFLYYSEHADWMMLIERTATGSQTYPLVRGARNGVLQIGPTGDIFLSYSISGDGVYFAKIVNHSLVEEQIYNGHSLFTQTVEDSNGTAYVLFNGLNGVVLASNPNSVWQYENLTNWTAVRGTSIAVDNNDHIHVIIVNGADDTAKYLTNESGSWEEANFLSLSFTVYFTDIEFDSNNVMHVCHSDSHSDVLYYSTYLNSNWQTDTVEYQPPSVEKVGWCDIELTHEDQPIIAAAYGLYYLDGGGWVKHSVPLPNTYVRLEAIGNRSFEFVTNYWGSLIYSYWDREQ